MHACCMMPRRYLRGEIFSFSPQSVSLCLGCSTRSSIFDCFLPVKGSIWLLDSLKSCRDTNPRGGSRLCGESGSDRTDNIFMMSFLCWLKILSPFPLSSPEFCPSSLQTEMRRIVRQRQRHHQSQSTALWLGVRSKETPLKRLGVTVY
jgi:hypothetical protein